jgi:hypothetical protein
MLIGLFDRQEALTILTRYEVLGTIGSMRCHKFQNRGIFEALNVMSHE